MENHLRSKHRNTANAIGTARMSTIERARAYQGMKQAMALGNLTLEACSRIRALLRSVARSFGRKIAATS